MEKERFNYLDERFADIQMLRYRLNGFDELTLRQKLYIYCLSQATLYGRDITFDQQGKYNLRIRKILELIYTDYQGDRSEQNFKALEIYLKRVWFSSGIHHHYGCEKFKPEFTEEFFSCAVRSLAMEKLPLMQGETVDDLLNKLVPLIFDETLLAKRVNLADGVDLVRTSACNFYENINQEEVERYYNAQKDPQDLTPISYGLNSKLSKKDGKLTEERWTFDGMYGNAIKKIVYWLEKAKEYAENDDQERVISLLVRYYQSGDLKDFDEYSIAWVCQHEGLVDFINGFIEVYGDPLGLKGTWEGLVEYKDVVASQRTKTISDNAQWFEDHSPIDPRFKKKKVKGVSANVICAAMLGGDEYPASAIGINLPNSNWIRQEYGSKSVTIGNLTEAYDEAGKGGGLRKEFVVDDETISLLEKYASITENLHTDLHECLGHGSGQLLPNTDPDALKNYGNTIEEARADLFGLYYIADDKFVELCLLPNSDAYKSQYYSYLLNGLLTQNIRIKLGDNIEEAHMRNRALISHWVLEHCNGAAELIRKEGKTYLKIHDYATLRSTFGELLKEIQRIKSEGDYDAARILVEKYAIHIDQEIHQEILERYAQLNLAPYKGFVNPQMIIERTEENKIINVKIDYTESYTHQMLRYSTEYNTLI